ncbi:hypothetical protein REA38_11730 [Serratia sp. MF2]|uniref:hypothetical protein n=1 Tax=Serratia sp. MF1(2023) TaxID=3059171 RepID=UPI0027FF4243|nr:hypothetical protein [Serratia sp. MF1(2023)]MDQ7104220.1 hypothetical protein [Serratia sp. MF1(2023)]
MSNLPENEGWIDGIYQLETTDPVLGGPDGISNRQATQLASRTVYLKSEVGKKLPLTGGELTGGVTINGQSKVVGEFDIQAAVGVNISTLRFISRDGTNGPVIYKDDNNRLNFRVDGAVTTGVVAHLSANGAFYTQSLSLGSALPIASGGTGGATAAAARSNLGMGTAESKNNSKLLNNATGERYFKIATLTNFFQGGYTANITISGGSGFNGTTKQNAYDVIVLRTGNGQIAQGLNGRIGGSVFKHRQKEIGVTDLYIIESAANTFDVYIKTVSFSSRWMIYVSAPESVTINDSISEIDSEPVSVMDAEIVQMYSNVIPPSAEDVGALSLTGGTVNGTVGLNKIKFPEVRADNSSDDISREPAFDIRYTDTNSIGYPASLGLLISAGLSDTRKIQFFGESSEYGNAKLFFRSLRLGNSATLDWYKVYTESSPPTAAEVGALPISGGTINGEVGVNNIVFPLVAAPNASEGVNRANGFKIESYSGTSQTGYPSNDGSLISFTVAPTRNVQFAIQSGYPSIFSYRSIRNDDATQTSSWIGIYTTNNKPTPSEIGALPISGGETTGQVTVATELRVKGRSSDNTAVMRLLQNDGTNRGLIYNNADALSFRADIGTDIGTALDLSNNGDLSINGNKLHIVGYNAGLEIGRVATPSSPYIDFHSSGQTLDYDVRIIAAGGGGSDGAGSLTISAAAGTAFNGSVYTNTDIEAQINITAHGSIHADNYITANAAIHADADISSNGAIWDQSGRVYSPGNCPFPIGNIQLFGNDTDPRNTWPGTDWQDLNGTGYDGRVLSLGYDALGIGGNNSVYIGAHNLPDHSHQGGMNGPGAAWGHTYTGTDNQGEHQRNLTVGTFTDSNGNEFVRNDPLDITNAYVHVRAWMRVS